MTVDREQAILLSQTPDTYQLFTNFLERSPADHDSRTTLADQVQTDLVASLEAISKGIVTGENPLQAKRNAGSTCTQMLDIAKQYLVNTKVMSGFEYEDRQTQRGGLLSSMDLIATHPSYLEVMRQALLKNLEQAVEGLKPHLSSRFISPDDPEIQNGLESVLEKFLRATGVLPIPYTAVQSEIEKARTEKTPST